MTKGQEGNLKYEKLWHNLKGNYSAIISILFIILLITSAVFSKQIAPHDPMSQDLMTRLKPPFWMEGGSLEYPLGTDHLGRDLFSWLIYGARISLVISFLAVVLSGVFGGILGLFAGYYGGLVRSEVLNIKSSQFVEAAKAIGVSDIGVIFKHIAPNVINSLIILATLRTASVVLLESALSFLGLGIQEMPTWGVALANGRHYLNNAWWLATFSGLSIFFTILSVNLVGDWLRDVSDPYLRNL
ncbi:peptide/nickel transport system permease protein [Halanaerobium sp. MA284_MarDTE_T2]|nr:ABC transporter permease [Halanaerobium sp. MA284_MarDTE_T2]RCW48296.1 peptide/nickel transport system permease protein [Halanaerobium sp. MA284_MarDTE_T2]RCW85723.1 peptide/nickel transport system permease protein [Halanaerobium sp. DL-01]